MSARKGKQEVFDPSDHPMVTVFYPEIPPCPDLNDTSTSLEREAAALIYMCLFVPHRGDPKGGHATWMDALRAPEAQMHMRRALKAHKSNAQCRQEWELDKQRGMERWVREINWTPMVKMVDPELYARAFGTSHCAHCRARSGAASPSAPLLRCSVCLAVTYAPWIARNKRTGTIDARRIRTEIM